MATALPSAASFTGSTVTEAQFKGAITDLRTYLATLMGADGEAATALETLGAAFSKYHYTEDSYALTSSDRGIWILGSGNLTITAPSVATVGPGFVFAVRNGGGGIVNIASTDTIDGASSIQLRTGDSAIVCSTDVNWWTVGRLSTIADGSVTTAKLDSIVELRSVTSGTAQSATTTYSSYLSTSITVEANDSLYAFASVTFDATSTAGQTFGLRISMPSASQTRTIVPTSRTAGGLFTVSTSYRNTSIGTGAQTVTASIYCSQNSLATVRCGDLLVIREPLL